MNLLNSSIDKAFPSGYPIVFLHAHPDDESFLSAGILNQLISTGRECVVVFGSAAIINGVQKTFVRQKEAAAACKLIGVRKILYLPYCEPHYTEPDAAPFFLQNTQTVSDELFSILEKSAIRSPYILVSYDENGGYGNKDHKAIHACGRIVQNKHATAIPILYEITINRTKILNWLEEAEYKLGVKSIPKLSYWTKDFGLTSADISYKYQLSEQQTLLKRQALACHESQMIYDEFPLSLPTEEFSDFFSEEFLKTIVFEPKQFFEIEKKYIVTTLPAQLSYIHSAEINQGYLSISDKFEEDRIRAINGKYFRSITQGVGIIKQGSQEEITQEQFNELWPKTIGKRVRKTRLTLEYQRRRLEVDIYHENLKSLITVEVEFPTLQAANEFIPPHWFSKEVTNDIRFRNQSLAVFGIPKTVK